MVSNKVEPKLIIHGGAGGYIRDRQGLIAVRKSLQTIVAEIYSLLKAGASATESVIKGCQLLEDEPRFNAGTGSVLQTDGQIRMSAALMDGSRQRFSGVINVSRLKNPIQLAEALQQESDRVLSDYGASLLLRELNIPVYDPLVELRLKEWLAERKDDFFKRMANVIAEAEIPEEEYHDETHTQARRGTIGVVALDTEGRLAAGTSTGGKGLEKIGRVSDSAMPAGNYADGRAAVSCTGIGEDIIDECLAARIVIRVGDGVSLVEAIDKSMHESQQRQRDLGAIAISQTGTIAWGKTSEVLLAAYHNGTEQADTLEWEGDHLIGYID